MVRSIETLIFCDVDGVLNVCAKDPTSGHPVLLSGGNVLAAMTKGQQGTPTDLCAKHILAVHERAAGHGEGESASYAKFVCADETHLCEIMVKRLATLIRIAKVGGCCRVVLSSTWRRSKYQAKVSTLEQLLSEELGHKFEFDGRTSVEQRDSTPEGRLRSVGNYIAQYWKGRTGLLRVLMLEDFGASPMDGSWSCGSHVIEETGDCEHYLCRRAALGRPRTAMAEVSACVVHTYEHGPGAADGDLDLHIGCGLTWPHFTRALVFLEGDATLTGWSAPVLGAGRDASKSCERSAVDSHAIASDSQRVFDGPRPVRRMSLEVALQQCILALG